MPRRTTRSNRYRAFRGMLESRAHELSSSLRSMLTRPPDSIGVTDAEEASSATAERELGFTVLQMNAETCKRMLEALGRLRAGTYGTCEDCDAAIPAARLRALPFATLCRGCQERFEQAPSPALRPLWPGWTPAASSI